MLHSTPRRSWESSPGPPTSKANALSTRQIFWDDRIQKIAIANTMRGAILQIQNTNVHTPRPMRGAIPRAQNLRFATVSRDRPTESYERVHPAKSKCAFRYSGVPSKMSKCTFRYSGVRKIVHGVGSRPRHRKIIVLPQFQTPDHHEVTKGLHRRRKNLHFTTVLDVRRARSDERVARRPREFAFHHSFGRPTSTFCVKDSAI